LSNSCYLLSLLTVDVDFGDVIAEWKINRVVVVVFVVVVLLVHNDAMAKR